MRHRFSYVTSIVTYIALLLGKLVVATNAGDACGTITYLPYEATH